MIVTLCGDVFFVLYILCFSTIKSISSRSIQLQIGILVTTLYLGRATSNLIFRDKILDLSQKSAFFFFLTLFILGSLGFLHNFLYSSDVRSPILFYGVTLYVFMSSLINKSIDLNIILNKLTGIWCIACILLLTQLIIL